MFSSKVYEQKMLIKVFIKLVFLCMTCSFAKGQIATDATFGDAQTLNSIEGDYEINESLGKKSGDGSNLFLSFDEFNVNTGESATFTGSDSIQNVISRVTGGNVSNIDGLLRSTIGSADLYFLNPAGVIFGPNATLDLPGAFHVSTADFIEFGDDQLFYANPMESSVLSTAAPTAFGFLDVPSEGVTVDGADLSVSEGKTLSLVGGTVEVANGAQLIAESGQVNLMGTGSAGKVVFETSGVDPDVSSLSNLGTVAIKENSSVSVSGFGSGRIFIRGGQIVVEDSDLLAQTQGDVNGDGIDIVATGQFDFVRSLIDTRTSGIGRAGDISILTDTMTIDVVDAFRQVGIFSNSTVLVGTFSLFLDIFHAWNSDLVATLISPSDTEALLFSDVGDNESNFTNTRFDDSAALSINEGFAPFTDSFRPEEPLSTFAGEDFEGAWTLRIEDVYAEEDGGSLNSWGLEINGQNFSSFDVPKDIDVDGISDVLVESTVTVANVGGDEGKAGTISVAANSLNVLTDARTDAQLEATSGTQTGMITVDVADIQFNNQSGVAIETSPGIVEFFATSNGHLDFDGSLGLAFAPNGPNYRIDARFGQIEGANLFHSFGYFNLDEGEIAVFSGPSSISNIISRVTAGDVSDIFGTIRSDIDRANLYFLNPAGFLFWEGASLDTTGAFHVSTADYLTLDDEEQFDISISRDSNLTIASPKAFGFSDADVGAIELRGVSLEASEESVLSFVGENIIMTEDALLKSSGGQINLVSVASAGEAIFDTDGSNQDLDTTSFSEFGEITLEGSGVEVSGDIGGRIFIRSNQLLLSDEARLSANTERGNPDEFGRGIDIDAKDDIQLDRSSITLNTFGTGNGGELNITVGDHLQTLNGSSISASTFSPGNAGNIHIDAGNLTLEGDGGISSVSSYRSIDEAGDFDFGNGGELDIMVEGYFQLLDGAEITLDTRSFSFGNAGNLRINAGDLTLDGVIRSISFGNGNGGELDITVEGRLQLLDGAEISVESAAVGDAGTIRINAGDLTSEDGSISASSSTQSTAGTIHIDAGNLTFDGGNISSFGLLGGNGGELEIIVEEHLQLLNGANINVSSFSLGNAGNLRINARNLTLDNGASINSSSFDDGNGGELNIIIEDHLQVLSVSSISASTSSSGNAGNILINADSLTLDGNSAAISSSSSGSGDSGELNIVVEDDLQLLNGSTITTASVHTNAGMIDLQAGGEIRVINSSVSIQAGQGVVDGVLESSERFQLDNLTGTELQAFLDAFEFPELKMAAAGDIEVFRSEINAEAGLLGGSASIKSINGSVRIEDSTVTLASDQLGMNVVDVWNAFIDPDAGNLDGVAFRVQFPELFSKLTVQAKEVIYLSGSKLITDAGLEARRVDQGSAEKIRGFGGSIELLVPQMFPTQINLLNSTLRAESYAMGGNVLVDPYYYVVNRSDVITGAEFIGGDYIINAEFLLQSLDSEVDLSGQQSGSFISSAVNVDLGSELMNLRTDFLNPESFVQVSCDLYYVKERSSFIVEPAKVQLPDFGDYLPSRLPDHLNWPGFAPSISDVEAVNGGSLPRLDNNCIDCI